MNLRFFSLSALFSSLALYVCGQSVQFCRVDVERKSDLCVAISSIHNATTDSYDLYMTFSLLFEKRQGWCAFGIGDAMDGALMFVMYPGKIDGDVTFSARSTTGHLPPTPIDNQSIATHIDTRVDGIYHVVTAICHSCDQWTGNDLDMQSAHQPWLFSTHYHQRTRTDDEGFRLVLHTDYGKLDMDMSKSISVNGDFPEISQERASTTGSTMSKTSNALSTGQIHGFILAFATIIIFGGIIGIRCGHKKSFAIHWMLQILASIGVFIGCSIGIHMSKSPLQLNLWSLHKTIGALILLLVPLQVIMGYRHHINYLKFSTRTKVSYWHMWIGRVMYLGLNLNVIMGLCLAEASRASQFSWVLFILIEAGTLSGLWIIHRRRERREEWKAGYAEVQEGDSLIVRAEEHVDTRGIALQ